MKNLFHKLTSFSMALIVLFSTFSFTVEQHYCGDVLVDYSFVGKAKSCGMDIQKPTDTREHNSVQKSICNDETLSVIGQHDLKVSLEKLSFEQHQFVVAFVYSYLNSFQGLPENIVPFTHYPPHLLVKDILILDQTFLI